jgi:uncharacterized lipoprotein YddW (UPF0748 family)/putative cell wall-binding protein
MRAPSWWRGVPAVVAVLLLTAPTATAAPSAPARAATAEGCVSAASTAWPITRLAGPDRFATAACVARAGYPDGSDTVLLARGDAAGGFADALAGTVLAHALDAPVLLTGPRTLDPAARDTLASLGAERVLVLGGSAAIDDAVVAAVEQQVPDVTRVAGTTRAATAAKIAARVPGDGAFVVNGHRPADALTAGAAAARAGQALLLVDQGGVPAATREALVDRSAATIVGGTGVVDTVTEDAVRRLVGGRTRRLGGGTRYETAATVARAHPGEGVVHLVSGDDRHLVDAIAAGWSAARTGGGPVVYTTRDAPDRATDRYLRLGPLADAPETRVLGGTASVGQAMVDALEDRYAEAAAGGPPPEQRGMWVHMFDDSLKTRAGIERVLDTATSANLNTVVVQATRRHDAYYDSDVLPATTDPDLEPGLDVLETLVPAAHARGLQVHVWWSLMPSTHPSMQDEDLGPDHVNTRHGVDGTGESWMAAGWTPGYEYLDPAIPGVQQHVVDMVTEVVRRHDVDGVQLDYLRYECLRANSDGTCIYSDQDDEAATGNQNPITRQRYVEHGDGRSLADFMRDQVTDLLRRVNLEVAAIDPSVVVSGALIAQGPGPRGEDLRHSFRGTRAYVDKGQDWAGWIDQGLLDHAYPMDYFRASDPTHATWFEQWAAFADHLDTPDHVTALGQAAYLNCVPESLAQLRRSLSALDGAMVYSYQGDRADSCAGEQPGDLFRALSAPDGLFATPAGVPEVPRRTPATDVGHVLVAAADGDRVELVPLDTAGTGEVRRADATGHAGFVDLVPGTYILSSDAGLDRTVEVRAGEVTEVT